MYVQCTLLLTLGRFRELCQKNKIIMSVFIENAIKRFVDSR